MKTVTTRVDSDTHAEIEERADESDQSKSAVARELIRRGLDYDSLKAERDDLRRQLRETNRRVDEHQELVEYVEKERRLQQRREERRDAPLWRRTKWFVLGRGDDEETA